MRHLHRTATLLAFAVAFALAGAANADKLLFNGTHGIKFSNFGGIDVAVTGTGVATVNGSAGGFPGAHLNTLAISQHFATLSSVIPITDPIVTAGGVVEVRLDALRFNPQGQGGIFAPVSGALQNTTPQLSQGTMPIAGMVRVCLFYAGCNSGALTQTLSQTTNGVFIGNGVGGLVTIGGEGAIRISLLGAPWTVNTVSVSNRTNNGQITFLVGQGFAHGPASLTSSTVATSGVVQLVTANQTTVVGVPGNSDKNGQISRLVVQFTPEPGILLLLGAGAVGLAVLGRGRIRK